MIERDEREMLVMLGRIDSKLDGVVTSQGDHEDRIRHLEQWQWKVAGAASIVGGIIVSGASFIVQHGMR